MAARRASPASAYRCCLWFRSPKKPGGSVAGQAIFSFSFSIGFAHIHFHIVVFKTQSKLGGSASSSLSPSSLIRYAAVERASNAPPIGMARVVKRLFDSILSGAHSILNGVKERSQGRHHTPNDKHPRRCRCATSESAKRTFAAWSATYCSTAMTSPESSRARCAAATAAAITVCRVSSITWKCREPSEFAIASRFRCRQRRHRNT